ncbi:MAG: dihydroorotate dehydrogenase electron transfer subunit [Planctomycetes bacterium]|nr:dihydroorotate dehydrogenase electron transfer subunit [Planctomycetota bacterium]
MRGFPIAQPGQFVHLIPSESNFGDQRVAPQEFDIDAVMFEADSQIDLTVRRAFSIAGLRRSGDHADIDILYRVVGKCTRWMSKLSAGDRVNVLGPVGNHFTVAEGKKLALLIAGGVGLPPMIWWAQRLSESNIETLAFVGAQSRDLLALELSADDPPVAPPAASGADPNFSAREFTQHGVKVVLSTDDGSLGFAGYVTDALAGYLDAHSPDAGEVTIYSCGPELMMKAVADLCALRRIDCQLCMERSMACGMGTCQSCVVPVHDADAPDGWRYKLCCTEGPIFDARQVIWD